MQQVQASRRQRMRGSALLLTLLLTITGAAILGLTVDAMALVWARSNAQTTANLTAAAVALEQERNPGVSEAFLVETARSAAGWNGYRHGKDSAAIHLERQEGRAEILVERDAGVFFLLMIRPEPVAIRARAAVGARVPPSQPPPAPAAIRAHATVGVPAVKAGL